MGRDLSRYEAMIDELVEVDGAGRDGIAFVAGIGAVLRRLNRIGRPSALADAVDGLALAMAERGAVVALKGDPAPTAVLAYTKRPPQEPGWYWVLVQGGSPYVEEFLDGRLGKPGNPAVRYAGPISAPEEPNHGD